MRGFNRKFSSLKDEGFLRVVHHRLEQPDILGSRVVVDILAEISPEIGGKSSEEAVYPADSSDVATVRYRTKQIAYEA